MSKPEIKQHQTWRLKRKRLFRAYILAISKAGYIIYASDSLFGDKICRGKLKEGAFRLFYEPDPYHTLCFKEANFD